MRRLYQACSLLCIALGAYLAYEGYRLRLVGQLGPGPGFFPFWTGIALVVVGALWLTQASLRGAPRLPTGFVPVRGRLLTLAAIVLALVAFMLLLRPLGFNLAMLLLLLFLFFLIDRSHPVAKVVLAFLGSFGVHYLFEQVLRVPLPFASWGALRQFGL